MQRADDAGNTRPTCASCGNAPNSSAPGNVADSDHAMPLKCGATKPVFTLIGFPIEAWNKESDVGMAALHDARTLLDVISDIGCEAADRTGFWHRDEEWVKRRFDHLNSVAHIMMEKLDMALAHLKASDDLMSRTVRRSHQWREA